jgi:hypothetical protein
MSCKPECHFINPGKPGHRDLMMAQKGNEKFSEGEVHEQCPGCWLEKEGKWTYRELKEYLVEEMEHLADKK